MDRSYTGMLVDMGDSDATRVVLLGAKGHGKSFLAARLATVPTRRRYQVIDLPASDVPGGTHGAAMAVLVVDVAESVMPDTRKHVELVGAHRIPVAAVFLREPEGIDTELVDLVEMEVRELLNKYKAGGDDTPVGRGREGVRQVANALDSRRL